MSSRCRRTRGSSWADGQARRGLHRGAVARRVDRPEVDQPQPALDRGHHHRGLRLPAVAVRARGDAALPGVREPITRQTPQQIVDRCWSCRSARGSRCWRRWCRVARGSSSTCSPSCRARAIARARVDGEVNLTEPPKLEKQKKHTIEVVVDRLVAKGDDPARSGGSPTRSRPRSGWPVDWCWSTSSTGGGRPGSGPRAALLRADGLPQRPPVGDRRGRAAVVLVQQPVRRLPGVHRPGHRGGGPRAASSRRGPELAEGAIAPWGRGSGSADYFQRVLTALAEDLTGSPSTRRGEICPSAPSRRCCTGRTTRCT
jgi:excinuclease ABC subunit A